MRSLSALAAAALLLTGCQNNAQLDAHLELMNAERRALEDELYDLEYEYEALVQKLDEIRRENERLRGGEDDPDDSFLDLPSNRDSDPSDELPEFELSPPEIDPGVPTNPNPEPATSRRQLTNSEPFQQPVSLDQPPAAADSSPRSVTHIYINPALTKAADFDGQPGSDGLNLVIEPRDDTGAFVAEPGSLSVVLLDYANRGQGSLARFARWDLDAQRVRQALFDSEDQQGVHLQLPWPEKAPQHRQLRMDVRYTSSDGRQFETRQDLVVTPVNSPSTKPQLTEPRLTKRQSTGAETAASPPRVASGWAPRGTSAQANGQHAAEQPEEVASSRTGPPWSLERAAGDAIQAEAGSHTDGGQSRQAARPTWKPYR